MRSSSGRNYDIVIPRFCLVLISSLILLGSGCKNDDDRALECDNEVVISDFQFENAESATIEINSIEINGDLLTIEISSGGCSGSSWSLCLIDSGAVMESFPPQRRIRFVLRNDESCLAYITRSFSFDISSLQVEGNTVILQVNNYQDSIEYTY